MRRADVLDISRRETPSPIYIMFYDTTHQYHPVLNIVSAVFVLDVNSYSVIVYIRAVSILF